LEEHCPQPGLPAREDFVIVAEALSQVSHFAVYCSYNFWLFIFMSSIFQSCWLGKL